MYLVLRKDTYFDVKQYRPIAITMGLKVTERDGDGTAAYITWAPRSRCWQVWTKDKKAELTSYFDTAVEWACDYLLELKAEKQKKTMEMPDYVWVITTKDNTIIRVYTDGEKAYQKCLQNSRNELYVQRTRLNNEVED